MISLSCLVRSWSMSAMRALIVVSRSFEIFSPCITSSTSLEICRRDSSRCSSLLDRVWPMTWSRRLASWLAASSALHLPPFASQALVPVDVRELAVAQAGQCLLGLAGQVRQFPEDEGQLLHLDRVARLHVVGDLHPRRPFPVQLVLRALSRHVNSSLVNSGPKGR